MSIEASSSRHDEDKSSTSRHDEEKKIAVDKPGSGSPAGSSIRHGLDVLALQDLDPAMDLKMHLVNDVGGSLSIQCRIIRCSAAGLIRLPFSQAIDEIGFTLYHWKLFFLNGFGYVLAFLGPGTGAILAPRRLPT